MTVEDKQEPRFTPEARAELLAMYAGLAMQGLLSQNAGLMMVAIAENAVLQADKLITAIESYHNRNNAATDRANVVDIKRRKAEFDAADNTGAYEPVLTVAEIEALAHDTFVGAAIAAKVSVSDLPKEA